MCIIANVYAGSTERVSVQKGCFPRTGVPTVPSHLYGGHPQSKRQGKLSVEGNIQRRTMTTLKEARKIFREHAATKYRGSKQNMLLALISATYRGKTEVDVTGRTFTVKADDLRKAVRVEDQQLMRLIKSLDEVAVIERRNGKISYTLDLKPLEDAEPVKDVIARQNKARTEAARKKKAAQRAAQREPDYSAMDVSQIVQHGVQLFEDAAAER